MTMPVFSFLYFCFLFLSIFTNSSNSALDSFVYAGCTQQKYNPGTLYESNVNSILASFVNSASFLTFNKFKISLPGSTSNDIVYGLFQCRGDLRNSGCHQCIANAVSRLGSTCGGASGGALQFEGCFIKYDKEPFLDVEEKTLVYKKCGSSIEYDSDVLTRRDAVLSYLTGGGQFFRVGGTGKVEGMTQCVEDLSVGECQDCVSEAIQHLKNQCGSSSWGDVYLGKCYARYSERGYASESSAHRLRRGWWFTVGCIVLFSLVMSFI